MFKKNMQNIPYPMENQMIERLYYELDSQNRKIKNLNNRLKRVEGFLGLRQDERFEEEIDYRD